MKTVTAKRVFERVVRLTGRDPAVAPLTSAAKANLAQLVTDAVREAYQAAWWPQTLVAEQRYFRAAWDAGDTYAVDAEVYYDGAYYVSLQAANTNHLPDETASTWWELVGADFVAYIDFAQLDATVIHRADAEHCIYDQDPRVYGEAGLVTPVRVEGERIYVVAPDAPAQPWVKFQATPPEFSWTDWSGATAYAIGDLAFLDSTGESYRALQASTNKNPYTEPAYWEAVGVPEFLEKYVRLAAAAELLAEDQGRYQTRAAAAEELEKLIDSLEIAQSGRRATFRR